MPDQPTFDEQVLAAARAVVDDLLIDGLADVSWEQLADSYRMARDLGLHRLAVAARHEIERRLAQPHVDESAD